MTCVPARTQDEGNKGRVDEVAHTMIEASRRDFFTKSSASSSDANDGE